MIIWCLSRVCYLEVNAPEADNGLGKGGPNLPREKNSEHFIQSHAATTLLAMCEISAVVLYVYLRKALQYNYVTAPQQFETVGRLSLARQ